MEDLTHEIQFGFFWERGGLNGHVRSVSCLMGDATYYGILVSSSSLVFTYKYLWEIHAKLESKRFFSFAAKETQQEAFFSDEGVDSITGAKK